MKTRDQLFQTEEYWLVQMQAAFFKAAKDFQTKNGFSQKQLSKHLGKSPGRISQILNGDFNARLSTLIEYAMAMGYVPEVKFTPIDSFLQRERERKDRKRYSMDNVQAIILDTQARKESASRKYDFYVKP
jgi:transcriptional regulator with XRE-family HTH domain